MSNDEHPQRRQWLLARLAEADGVTYDSLCHDVIEAFQVRAKGRSRSQLRYQHYASSTRGVLGQYGESWDDEGHTNITECIPYHNDDPALPGAEDRRLAREARHRRAAPAGRRMVRLAAVHGCSGPAHGGRKTVPAPRLRRRVHLLTAPLRA